MPRGVALGLALAALAACGEPGPPIPAVTVERGDPALQRRNGVLYLGVRDGQGGAPFSGYLIERAGPRVVARTPFFQGREEGWAYGYYPNGRKRFARFYKEGRKERTHRGWWENGNLQFVYRYQRDAFEGEQVSFYKNGQRAELRHYRAGYEEGQQRAWSGEGQLMANYTFKNGRRYGIVGRFDCVTVHQQ
jgi:antitoxin component YwqK of YwqJK toxin-antitoxin module